MCGCVDVWMCVGVNAFWCPLDRMDAVVAEGANANVVLDVNENTHTQSKNERKKSRGKQ